MKKGSLLTIDSDDLKKLLLKCAALRGQERFNEAIELVEPQLVCMSREAQVTALLQLIYAADEAGDASRTRRFAEQLAKLDPDIPSVKKVLARYKS